MREDDKLEPQQRDAAVDDLIALIGAVDGILQAQAKADTAYFVRIAGIDAGRGPEIEATVLKAYRWQYIVSGAMEPRFQKILGELVTPAQMERIGAALQPLMAAVPANPRMALPMAA